MLLIPSFSLKPPLQSYHDMGFFFLQPCLLPFFKDFFIDVRKTSSPRNPLHKPITTADAKHDISLYVFLPPFFTLCPIPPTEPSPSH